MLKGLHPVTLTYDLALEPATVLCDYELAIIQAVALNFPNSQHHGCYYHYKQALWRKVQTLGLALDYTNPQVTALWD